MNENKASAIAAGLGFIVLGGIATHFIFSGDNGLVVVGGLIALVACWLLYLALWDWGRN